MDKDSLRNWIRGAGITIGIIIAGLTIIMVLAYSGFDLHHRETKRSLDRWDKCAEVIDDRFAYEHCLKVAGLTWALTRR